MQQPKSLFDTCVVSLFRQCLESAPSKFIEDVDFFAFIKEHVPSQFIGLTPDDFIRVRGEHYMDRDPYDRIFSYTSLCQCSNEYCMEGIYWKGAEERYDKNHQIHEGPLVCSFVCYYNLRRALENTQQRCPENRAWLARLHQFYPQLQNETMQQLRDRLERGER